MDPYPVIATIMDNGDYITALFTIPLLQEWGVHQTYSLRASFHPDCWEKEEILPPNFPKKGGFCTVTREDMDDMSYSLNSLMGFYEGDYIREY